MSVVTRPQDEDWPYKADLSKARCSLCKGRFWFPYMHWVGWGTREPYPDVLICDSCCVFLRHKSVQADIIQIAAIEALQGQVGNGYTLERMSTTRPPVLIKKSAVE